MLIKVLYVLFVLCTVALVAVAVGVVLRVRRHMKAQDAGPSAVAAPQDDSKPPEDPAP